MKRKIDLGDALKNVGDGYVRENPADLATVRERVEGYHKRRWWTFAAAGVAAAASIVLIALVVVNLDLGSRDELAPAALPLDYRIDTAGAPLQVEGRGPTAFVALEDNSVLRVDLGGTDPVWTSRFGSAPSDVIWGQTGVWVTLPEEDLIVRLDSSSGVELQRIELAPEFTSPTRLTVGVRALRAVVSSGVIRLDLTTGAIEELYEGDITDIAMGRSGFWLVNTRGAIFAIDPDSGIPVAGLRTETRTPGGEITFARNAIWYGRDDSDVLVVINETSGILRSRISLPGNYVDLDAGADGPWVLTTEGDGEGRITALDHAIGQLGATTRSLGGNPVDLSTGSAGIWVTQADAARLVHLAP